MTSIAQVAPAATVPPLTQGVNFLVAVNAFSAKSPLVVMVLMFSVDLPTLVRMTFFGALVLPTPLVPKFSNTGE